MCVWWIVGGLLGRLGGVCWLVCVWWVVGWCVFGGLCVCVLGELLDRVGGVCWLGVCWVMGYVFVG